MITTVTTNYPKAPANIPHKTPPSLGRPQSNNQSSIIPNQSNSQTAYVTQLATNYDFFMQNKPNLQDAQMNVSTVLTTDYQNIRPCRSLQNKPNLGSQRARNLGSEFIPTPRRHAGNGVPTAPEPPSQVLICKTNPISKKVKSV